jgi:hypothetical protein
METVYGILLILIASAVLIAAWWPMTPEEPGDPFAVDLDTLLNIDVEYTLADIEYRLHSDDPQWVRLFKDTTEAMT